MKIILEGGDYAGRLIELLDATRRVEIPTCSGAVCVYQGTGRVLLGRVIYEFIGDRGQLDKDP